MVAPQAPYDLELVRRILASHERLLGQSLVPGMPFPQAAAWLYEEAPFCLLAHDHGPDPLFIYANRSALNCFGYAWPEFVGMPSRFSAEAPNREERAALLKQVAEHGYSQGYRGLRIARSGRRFWIEDVTVWNVLDDQGRPEGQAAVYRRISPASRSESSPL
jgi:PAS domain S-box-containing protein